MSTNPTGHALVTGATSGLGYEAAAQLAEAGWARVTITGRDQARAEEAAASLRERTGRDVFRTVAVDLSLPDEVTAAIDQLTADSLPLDLLLLNAGMVSGSEQVTTADGVEITYASSLIGHHQLTTGLISTNALADGARIIIAGSEAARGDVPTFHTANLAELAAEHYDGNLTMAAEALIRGTAPGRYRPADTYATAKLFVAWWSAALARRLPAGTTVNAVSPGSAPYTKAARHANFFMRRIMMPVMKAAPSRLGMAAPTPVAASRYIEAAGYDESINGEFFASAPKKMVGPLHRMMQPHVHDEASQEAAWLAINNVAGTTAAAA